MAKKISVPPNFMTMTMVGLILMTIASPLREEKKKRLLHHFHQLKDFQKQKDLQLGGGGEGKRPLML